MIPRSGHGIVMQLISGAATSGVESNRIKLDSPLGLFGLCMTMASTAMTGLCGAALYGCASHSTSIQDASASARVRVAMPDKIARLFPRRSNRSLLRTLYVQSA